MFSFRVAQCLRGVKELITAASFGYSAESIERIDTQWCRVTVVEWQVT